MRKSLGLWASMAMIGGAAYILMSDKRTNKAKRIVNKAMDEANDMMCKKMN